MCVHTRIFSGELAVSVVTIKSVSRHGQMSPGNKLSPSEKCCPTQTMRPTQTKLPDPTDHLVKTSAWQAQARFPAYGAPPRGLPIGCSHSPLPQGGVGKGIEMQSVTLEQSARPELKFPLTSTGRLILGKLHNLGVQWSCL